MLVFVTPAHLIPCKPVHYTRFTGPRVTTGVTRGPGIHLGLHKLKREQNLASKTEKRNLNTIIALHRLPFQQPYNLVNVGRVSFCICILNSYFANIYTPISLRTSGAGDINHGR